MTWQLNVGHKDVYSSVSQEVLPELKVYTIHVNNDPNVVYA